MTDDLLQRRARFDFGYCPMCGARYRPTSAEVLDTGEVEVALICSLATDGPDEDDDPDDPDSYCDNHVEETVLITPIED